MMMRKMMLMMMLMMIMMQVADGEGDVPPGDQHGGHPHEQLRLQLPLCQH